MLSVSLIVPFMNVVLNPSEVMQNKYVKLVCGIFSLETDRAFMFFLSLVVAGIYILKNVFLLFQMTIQNRFVLNNMFLTQKKLLHSYLHRPYEYFLNVKSGEIIRIMGEDTSNAFDLLTTLLQMFSEIVVSGYLIVTIFFIAPMLTIGIAVLLSIMVVLIFCVIRPYLRNAGIRNRESYAKMNQWLLQSVQGIKDIKITQKEAFFEESFAKNGQIYVKACYQNQTLGLMPRFLIEAISMAAFFIMIAVLIYNGMALETIVPMLSAVAMAAIRLLPSTNRISHSMTRVAFGEPILDKMLELLRDAENYDIRHPSDERRNTEQDISEFNEEIILSNVTYQYSSSSRPVLDNSCMKINCGESIGIVGASGAGKTTVVDIMLGLLKPGKGKVLIDGTDIEIDYKGWLNQIGYIPQSIFMLDGDVRENVAFGYTDKEIDEERVWRALQEAAIDKDIEALPEGIYTQLGERGIRLSGGQRQRIGIARALYNNPSVLFFDEATSALDYETESDIMKAINQLHGTKTMIIIAHRLTTIEECDHIFRVENGKIIQER